MDTPVPDTRPRLTPGKGLLVLGGVAAGTAVYAAVTTVLGITTLYMGFIFSLYFGAFRNNDPREFVPAVLGSLGGIATAALLHFLPIRIGPAGFWIALAVIVICVYLLIIGVGAIVVNPAFMLALTVATIPPLQSEARFIGMAEAVLVAASLLGALAFGGAWATARRGRTRTG